MERWRHDRNKLVKKAKSNFWLWVEHFWAETAHDRRMVILLPKSKLKAELVPEWKRWVKYEANKYVYHDRCNINERPQA